MRRAESYPPRETRKAQRPKVVQAQNVVGVRVGVKHRVHAVQVIAQRLFAEIGPGVDHHHPFPSAPSPAPFSGSRQRSSTEGRSRRSRGSAEVHTAQSHPSVGTPIEVPSPEM